MAYSHPYFRPHISYERTSDQDPDDVPSSSSSSQVFANVALSKQATEDISRSWMTSVQREAADELYYPIGSQSLYNQPPNPYNSEQPEIQNSIFNAKVAEVVGALIHMYEANRETQDYNDGETNIVKEQEELDRNPPEREYMSQDMHQIYTAGSQGFLSADPTIQTSESHSSRPVLAASQSPNHKRTFSHNDSEDQIAHSDGTCTYSKYDRAEDAMQAIFARSNLLRSRLRLSSNSSTIVESENDNVAEGLRRSPKPQVDKNTAILASEKQTTVHRIGLTIPMNIERLGWRRSNANEGFCNETATQQVPALEEQNEQVAREIQLQENRNQPRQYLRKLNGTPTQLSNDRCRSSKPATISPQEATRQAKSDQGEYDAALQNETTDEAEDSSNGSDESFHGPGTKRRKETAQKTNIRKTTAQKRKRPGAARGFEKSTGRNNSKGKGKGKAAQVNHESAHNDGPVGTGEPRSVPTLADGGGTIHSIPTTQNSFDSNPTGAHQGATTQISSYGESHDQTIQTARRLLKVPRELGFDGVRNEIIPKMAKRQSRPPPRLSL